ncbi:type VI secretion system ImpA family N-terminal domain-containing protein [Haloferula sp. BvORR071]|uniref:type VI secretion system protein TssA n=1 Tax=Haloferula sp. BvORR071 TaxID=1396141 RepID=UPI002240F3A3|nr:type VI secretion system ImpA family N-terminal domain-containing protein [Haloferula sp. BvORR071]
MTELLTPVSTAPPCGPDLEDDAVSPANPGMMAQQAALYNLDALYSEARRPDSDDAAWQGVLAAATDFLGHNKHLRAAVYLCDAAMRRQRAQGLAQSLELVRKICETYWDDFHPLPSTPGGKQARVNILSGLAGNSFLAALRSMPFVSGMPEATLKAYEANAGADEDASTRAFAKATLGATNKEVLDDALAQATQSLEQAQWIVAKVDAAYAPDNEVDCGEFLTGVEGKLVKQLGVIRRILSHATGSPVETVAGAATEGTATAAAAPVAGAGGFSKASIRPMLDQIIDYYQQNEPSSPVPLLLLRAKRLMDLSFIDLVNDTAGEDAVRKAQQILGIGKEGS